MIHETPSDAIFTEMKDAAIEIWNTYSDEFGYRSEKLEHISNISNFQDNAMVCYRMFDHMNQTKMRAKLSNETKEYINHNL